MTATREEILAEIERRVTTSEAAPHEVDERVAAELGVPASDYFAYVVVAGAIERYGQWLHRQQRLPIDEPALPDDPLEQAETLVADIASAASAICLETPGEGQRDLYLAAAGIYAATAQLHARLREIAVDPDQRVAAERPAETAALATATAATGEEVASDGR